VFEARRVDFPPSHFEYAEITLRFNLKEALERWIENNLKGRYYLGRSVSLKDDNKLDYTIKVGFEESKELSFFMLACPHLKYK
jgi:hypothetical protein